MEYLEENPNGYRYSRFCGLYHQWRQHLDATMRQQPKAGEKMFVDYSGVRRAVQDPATGEMRPVEIFVAALGARTTPT